VQAVTLAAQTLHRTQAARFVVIDDRGRVAG